MHHKICLIQVEIPYETGMSPHSGLTEFFEAKGLLKKSGTRLEYTSPVTGEVTTQFRKVWDRNDNGCLDTIMSEYNNEVVDAEDDIVEETTNNEVTPEVVNES